MCPKVCFHAPAPHFLPNQNPSKTAALPGLAEFPGLVALTGITYCAKPLGFPLFLA
jgi:hypothetical protein